MNENHQELIQICNDYIKSYTERLTHLRGKIKEFEEEQRLLNDPKKNSNIDNVSLKNYKKIYEEKIHYINFNGYLVISLLDLSVNLKNVVVSDTTWENSFFIKNSYLVIHETINKLTTSKGRKFIEKSIKEEHPTLLNSLNNFIKIIENYKNAEEYENIMKVRHHIAGHIIEKLKAYYDRIFELDKEVAIKNIMIFIGILSESIGLINDYLELKEGKE
ncbi:hypothetical protein [Tenacibaculum finnmarkense]|uniref:hypothetical protein n=1 Tax=Tenacibaculum finnmarkense TaxID=2781243 RepID=UPI001E5756E6|nr:hypothetical protein [Tenacibaculum finnmarkense]MCD8448051.1 hypothetical protein [Tenacibaculum finnmarkense genomovar finnmarkense]